MVTVLDRLGTSPSSQKVLLDGAALGSGQPQRLIWVGVKSPMENACGPGSSVPDPQRQLSYRHRFSETVSKDGGRREGRDGKGLRETLLTESVLAEQLLFCNPRWSDRLLQNYITS